MNDGERWKTLKYDEREIIVAKDKLEQEVEREEKIARSPPEDFRELVEKVLSKTSFDSVSEAAHYHESIERIYSSCLGPNGYWIDPVKLFEKANECWMNIRRENLAAAQEYFAAVPSVLNSMHGKDENCIYRVLEKFGDYAKSLGGPFLEFSIRTDFCSYKIPNALQMIDYRAEMYQMPKIRSRVST